MCENKAVLYGKIAQVMGKLGRIKETGKHSQGWKYATSEDVKDAVRAAMSEVGLALLVSLEDHEVIGLDKGVIVRGKMAFTLCCSETGATETRHLVGEAADQAKVSDKAFYKLYTTLEKYFLKTTFLISSGEELDSDADVSPQKRGQDNGSTNGDMTLAKLLATLNTIKQGRIKGFYDKPEKIMACRSKGAEPPSPDDTQGWRVLLADAYSYAFEQIERAVEDDKIPSAPDQSPMDEVETEAETQF